MLALLVLAACAQAASPDEAPLRVYHDEQRVPHVFGASEAEAYRGLGYTQGLDFPVATLANLWSASGRFAEVAGAVVLARDERMRVWGLDRRAAELAGEPGELDADVRANLVAYVEGVNAGRRFWLAEPARIEALFDGGALGFDPVPAFLHPRVAKGGERKLLERLFASEITLEHVLALGLSLAAGPEFGGAGQATRTNVLALRDAREEGHTWFLADVHQPLQSAGYRSYFVQLSGGALDVVGHSSPGFPVVLLGANRELAIGSMTLPKAPRALAASGIPFRIGDDSPVHHGSWRAALAPGEPRRVERGAETLALVERVVTLRWFDPATGELCDDPRGALTLRALADPVLGFELPVTTPGPREALASGAELVYEARTFQAQRSLWESWMRLARARTAGAGEHGTGAALAREWLTVGRGQSCLFADVRGDFELLSSARAPVRTERGRAGPEPRAGGDPGLAWRGFHGADALWRVRGDGRGGGDGAGWILCNDSPHELPVEGITWNGPRELGDGERWRTLRQTRARELFRRAQADGKLEAGELQALALDVQDGWSRRNWPLLEALRGDAELSERAHAFLGWLAEHRHEGPDGKDGAEEFLAHARSRVMPFLVLVRDRLQEELVAEGARDTRALGLAFDPLVPVPGAEEYLGEGWAPHRMALRRALEFAAELHARPFANEMLLAGALPSEFLVSTPPQGGAPESVLRWGAVNVLTLTPHRLAFDPLPSNRAQTDDWLASMLAPTTVRGARAYHACAEAMLHPLGGTHDSLFQTHREGFLSYTRALFPRDEGLLYFAPVDFGSQALLLAELVPGGRPRVHVLSLLASTELLGVVPGITERVREIYLPTGDFLAGRWRELTTDEARLRADPRVRRRIP